MNGLFNNNSFPIKATPATFRTEKLRGPSKPVISNKIKSQSASRNKKAKISYVKNSPRKRVDDVLNHTISRKKPKLLHTRSSGKQNPLFSDTSDSESSIEHKIKTIKSHKLSRIPDKKRILRSTEAFKESTKTDLNIIHAADIVSTDRISKKTNGEIPEMVTVGLRYPSRSQVERFKLILGNDFNPAEEIIAVVTAVLDFYISEFQSDSLKNSGSDLLRKLTKAYNLLTRKPSDTDLLNEFKSSVEAYNSTIDEFVMDGTFSKNLDSHHNLPLYVVECILQQVYTRVVSPKVDILKRYENGSDNVYGELLPPLISKILGEAGLTSESIFVDLGSGVGNVVLQSALEFGCESWGCEMMENAFLLAEAQKKEFKVRCRLWAIETGLVHLERGDFLDNQQIHKVLQKADVVLVNNQAFTPDLNQKLKDLFLDLKDGCRIISLKSFVTHGHQISTRNLWDPANLLEVTEGEYHSRSVSWTDAGGSYFIAKKDEKRLLKFNGQQ